MYDYDARFVQFLLTAKRNTYAGDGVLASPSRLASKDYSFHQGDYLYVDTYLGDLDFSGEEAVWRQDKPVWSMNYYGVMQVDDIPEGFSRCLKAALQRAPAEAPYHGPGYFRDRCFEYACHWTGSLERFEGWEQILRDGKEIYRLVFHGGRLK